MKYLLLSFVLLLTSILSLHGQAPLINSFTPSSGPIGSPVNIFGANFSATPSEDIVYFGAIRAEVISSSSTQLSVVVPVGATYKPITVTVNGLTASSSTPFVATFTNSTGAFGNRVDLWAGAQVRWATVGDIDGDGKTDILAVDEAWNQLNVWRNTSTTGIISWDSFSFMMGFTTLPSPYALEVGDLDGDGKLDVVVTKGDGTTISVFQNTSSPGAISFAPSIEFETTQGPEFVSIGDLDKDGKLDIATANVNNFGLGTVSVLRNTSSAGTISFAPHVDFNTGEGGVWCVKLEDIDNDGKIDMLVTSGGSALLSVFRNISTPGSLDAGSFEPKVDFPTGAYPAIIATGDFDGDNKTDVAVGNANENTISLFRNTATSGAIDLSSFVREDISSQGPWNPTAGDVDGDGKLDILIRDGASGNLLVYKNSSSVGSFSFSPYTVDTGGGAPLGISVADLDGDTKADLMVSAELFNTIMVFQNMFVSPPTILPSDFVGNAGFELKWQGPENVYEYHIDVSPSEDFSTFVPGYQDRFVWGPPSTIIRVTVAGLVPNSDYYCRVRAVSGGTTSANSETSIVHTESNPPAAAANIWAKKFGGLGEEEIQSMSSDILGNIYIAGHYTGSITFGNTTLNSQGDFDIFFARLDPQGNVVWARSIGGQYYDNEVSIAVTSQGLFLTAQYAVDIDVDPGPGNTTFFNDGLPYINDSFFGRYNSQNGALVWARKLVDASAWSSSSIDADASGLYITGHFSGSVDFNPGPGIATLDSHGDEDVFLAKYTLQGNYVWADGMGGVGYDTSSGLLLDDSGVYIHGSYGDVADFNPRQGVFNLNGFGGFFGRYDLKNGSLQYVKNVGNQIIHSMTRFANRLYIVGGFFGTIDADPGPASHNIGVDGYNHGLIGCYDLLDGKYRWAQGLTATNFIGARKVLADMTGIYVSGFFAGSVDFDPGVGQANRSSGVIDAFASHYSREDGSLLWAKGIGSPGRGVSIAATLTLTGYYVGGLFGQTVNFDPYSGSTVMTSESETNDIFIAKYNRWCFDLRRPLISAVNARTGDVSDARTEDVVLSSSEAAGNQWFKNGELIPGATDVSFNVRSEGIYTVKCTQVGCSGVMSDSYNVTGKIGEKVDDREATTAVKSRVYPNPAVETVTLDLQGFGDGTIVITITDTYGKSMLNEATSAAGEHHFDVSRLSMGVYVIQARQGEKVFIERFIKR